MFSAKKFIVIFTLFMVSVTIGQHLLKEYEVITKVQEIVEEVLIGFKSFQMP